MIELFVYPSLRNQSTNHLEAGEHINGKKNTLKHLPIDFTVPLVAERRWPPPCGGRRRRAAAAARRAPRPRPLLGAVVAGRAHRAGSAAITARSQADGGGDGGGGGGGGAGGDGGGLLRWLGMA